MKELFEKAVSFRTFLLNQDKEMRIRFMKNYIPLDIKPEYSERIGKIQNKVNILGIVEDTCPECLGTIAVLEKLIALNPNINFRLMTQNNMDKQVPAFIFMKEDFTEAGIYQEISEGDVALNLLLLIEKTA